MARTSLPTTPGETAGLEDLGLQRPRVLRWVVRPRGLGGWAQGLQVWSGTWVPFPVATSVAGNQSLQCQG